jgi:hypothetical protein
MHDYKGFGTLVSPALVYKHAMAALRGVGQRINMGASLDAGHRDVEEYYAGEIWSSVREKWGDDR